MLILKKGGVEDWKDISPRKESSRLNPSGRDIEGLVRDSGSYPHRTKYVLTKKFLFTYNKSVNRH